MNRTLLPGSTRSWHDQARLVLAGSILAVALLSPGFAGSLAAQATPVIETALPFDSAGRVITLTPSLAARLGLTSPSWPVSGSFSEARLYRTEGGTSVLVVQRADGNVARYNLTGTSAASLRRAVEAGLLALGESAARITGVGVTGTEMSQPAGNVFVRNQAFLGLAAYGPATAAILSDQSEVAAAGGYLLAAGASFFVAAQTVRNRTVTRAQAMRAAHGGLRGGASGLAVAWLARAESGWAWGTPILAGALVGTYAGFRQAGSLTDGEAASSGLFADLGAATALGIGASAGAFRGRDVTYHPPEEPDVVYTHRDHSPTAAGKVAVGAAIGSSILGYAVGPRYARRAGYNVTAGDATLVLTMAALGGLGAAAIPSSGASEQAGYAAATAGVLAGALLADRLLVRTADRTTADGTLVQLGAGAGALIGAGAAAIAEWNGRAVVGAASAGGLLGLLAADRILAPARDAGPLRGIMQSPEGSGRLSLSIGPVTSVRLVF